MPIPSENFYKICDTFRSQVENSKLFPKIYNSSITGLKATTFILDEYAEKELARPMSQDTYKECVKIPLKKRLKDHALKDLFYTLKDIARVKQCESDEQERDMIKLAELDKAEELGYNSW